MAYELVNDFVAFSVIVFVFAVILLIFFIVLSPILNAMLWFFVFIKVSLSFVLSWLRDLYKR